jgi:hypothetical protein
VFTARINDGRRDSRPFASTQIRPHQRSPAPRRDNNEDRDSARSVTGSFGIPLVRAGIDLQAEPGQPFAYHGADWRLVFTDTCGDCDCINAVSPPGHLATNVKMSIACRACGRLLASIAPSRKPNCNIERIAIERRERYASDENRHAVSRAAPIPSRKRKDSGGLPCNPKQPGARSLLFPNPAPPRWLSYRE